MAEVATASVVTGEVTQGEIEDAGERVAPVETGAQDETEKTERRTPKLPRGATVLAAGATAALVSLSGCGNVGGGGGDAELGCQDGPKRLSATTPSHITARVKKGESYYDLPEDRTFDFGTFKASSGEDPKPMHGGKKFDHADRYINSGPYGKQGEKSKFRLRVRLEGSDSLGSAKVSLRCKEVPDKKK